MILVHFLHRCRLCYLYPSSPYSFTRWRVAQEFRTRRRRARKVVVSVTRGKHTKHLPFFIMKRHLMCDGHLYTRPKRRRRPNVTRHTDGEVGLLGRPKWSSVNDLVERERIEQKSKTGTDCRLNQYTDNTCRCSHERWFVRHVTHVLVVDPAGTIYSTGDADTTE